MKKSIACLICASAAFATPAAAADYLVNFTISGYGSGSATFTTATDASASLTLVDAITGTFNGNPITLLAPGTFPTSAPPANDNLFTSASPYFDLAGLSFSAAGSSYNLYAVGNSNFTCTDNTTSHNTACVIGTTITVQAVTGDVPEPATWAMMLLGFGAIGAAMRRTTRRSALKLIA